MYTPLDFRPRDWYKGFFETGATYKNSVSISGNNGRGGSIRVSFTDVRNTWIVPNTGYKTQSFSVSFAQKLRFVELAGKVNYYRKDSDNLPMIGYSTSSPTYTLLWSRNNLDIRWYEQEYRQTFTGDPATRIVYPYALNNLSDNPYSQAYEQLNTMDRDRVYGNVSATFDIYKGLKLMLRTGLDMNREFRTRRKPFGTLSNLNGYYRQQNVENTEMNNDFLLTYERPLGKFHVNANFGGNSMYQQARVVTSTAEDLLTEGVYNLSNAKSGVITKSQHTRKMVNSLYGLVQLSYDDCLFLDITGRNDWSSTLAPSNWSYFYPSVSASILLDKAFKINSPHVNMIKLRGSWAQVGNDTSVFSLYDDYSTTDYPGGVTLPTASNYPYILPEKTSSWEVGLETKFLGNRLNVDVALYKTSTRNQIISAETSAETGSTSRKMNAGLITNKGVEVTFRMVPVRTKDINWEINGNWSLNKNKLNELQNGWDPATPLQTSTSTTIGSRIFVYSYVGKSMHQLYSASHYEYAPEGSTYTDENGNQVDCSGMQIINAKTGYPLLTKETDSKKFEHLGSVIPDWKAGFGTTFRYKNLSLSAQFTAQVGGVAYSVTNFALSYQGKLKNSLAGRDDGLVLQGVNAVDNGDGTVSYQKNTAVTENIYTYYQSYKWVRDNGRENTFSTDFLKFKELRIDYQLPKHLMAKTRFLQGASIGFFATNLFCITDWPQFDPEAAGLVNGTNIYPGIETVTFPMTRTYGINIKLQF